MLAFCFVFVVVYALLAKTKILGESDWINATTSLLIALIFLYSPKAAKFTATTMPWIAVLIVVVLFILLILTFVRGKIDDFVKSPVISIILIAIVILIFFASAINVFGPLWSYDSATGEASGALAFFLTPAVAGALILLVIAAITTWVLIKAK